MIQKGNIQHYFVGLAPLIFIGCVERFTPKTLVFENNLVVDALLTNENKRHMVKLARTYRFEDEEPILETNARVQIKDNLGATYEFIETDTGTYLSSTSFSAVPGNSYQLSIGTTDGASYVSDPVVAPNNIPISNLSAERLVNDFGEEGVGILLDNTNNSSAPTYFRYEYEETYKIVAPNYDPFEFEIIDYTPCDGNFYEVGIKLRTEEQRICFGFQKSVGVAQATTTSLTNNDLVDFQIRFIDRTNYIISHRYSILVRQYTQTQDAYAYYEELGNFSSSDNIFSQIQPGFLLGNIESVNEPDEKVLGYFEVASVDQERVYFNYADLFPGEALPPYAVNCETPGNPLLVGLGYHCDGMGNCDGACESPLIEAILAGIVVFHSVNENRSADQPGPYFTLPSPCGDCTKLGSNVVPDFWED